MAFPESTRKLLDEIGQVAAEVNSQCEGCREFVTVIRTEQEKVNGAMRFPYLRAGAPLFRVMRFRVKEELVENDTNVCNEDLLDLQSVVIDSEDRALAILEMWNVPPDCLVRPADCSVPI